MPTLPRHPAQGMQWVVDEGAYASEAFEARAQGTFVRPGEVARVVRRYQAQPDRHTMQLSHCVRSIDQVGRAGGWPGLLLRAGRSCKQVACARQGVHARSVCTTLLALPVCTHARCVQVGALADMLVQLPALRAVELGCNDLDDQAFELLGCEVGLGPWPACVLSLLWRRATVAGGAGLREAGLDWLGQERLPLQSGQRPRPAPRAPCARNSSRW